MRAGFSSTVESWQSFYMLAGTASATLIGLLFVAISLHLDLIGEPGASAILSLARRTFTRFILVLIVALLFLVPRQDPEGLGLPLLAFGIVDVLRTLRVGFSVLNARERSNGLNGAVMLIGVPVALPLASGIGLALIAANLLLGTTDYLYWMVPVMGVMLTNAATNAWELMLGLAQYKARRASGQEISGGATPRPESHHEPLARSSGD
jgi:hypothetical protein